jgi:hypothetical protein
MQWMKGIGLAISLSWIAGSSVLAAENIAKPAVLDDAVLTVTASDLHGLIDGAGSVAAQISPMLNGAMLKNMIGMQLGDPQLAGIPAGKGLAVVALDYFETNVFAILEIAPAQLTTYTNILTQGGMQFQYAKNVLVVAPEPYQVELGVKYIDAVKNTLLAQRSPALRIAIKPSELIAKNNDQIQGMLKTMPAMMGMGMQQNPDTTPETIEGITRILEVEIRGMLSVAKQVKAVEMSITPANGSVRISEVIDPVAGTPLATFCNAPAVNKENPQLRAGLLGNGMVQIDFNMSNTDALSAFITTETDKLFAEIKSTSPDAKKLVASMKKWMAIYAGGGCESFRFDPKTGISADVMIAVKDEAAALEALKSISSDMAGFTKLYKEMGMPISYTFKENVREHAGVKIHQLVFNMSMDQIPAEQKKQFESMNLSHMSYEIAIAKGVMVYTMGDGKMDGLIDQIKSAKTTAPALKARSVYPASGCYYLDYNVGEYLGFIAELIPATPDMPPLKQFAELLKAADPITSAGYRNNGRIMWSSNIPGSLITNMGQIAMQIQMQQQMKQQQQMQEIQKQMEQQQQSQP